MQFEITHEFDAPIDVIELALMSPDLGPLLGHNLESLESVEATVHDVEDDVFRRVWRFQARAPLKVLRGYNITREMMNWDEHSEYRLDRHEAQWHVIPRADEDRDAAWRRRFTARGRYRLDPLRDGRTRRTVSGDMVVELKMIGRVVERIAVSELRRAYEAEADALRTLCSLP